MTNGMRFAMIPLAAIADHRMTFRMLKTFAAICSFRTSSSDYCVEASRDEIASRCGFNTSVVSTATTELQRLGWLVKLGAGGRASGGGGLKTIYTITIPDTVANSATVTESETVLKSGTIAESITTTVPDSGTLLIKEELNKDGGFSKSKASEPDGFAECWASYPKRDGGNSRSDALKAYRSRLKAGASSAEVLAGTKRYAAYCVAKGIVGTIYVKQASTFFGPGDHWQESWTVPSATPMQDQKPKAGDKRARHGITETYNENTGWVPA